MTRNRDSPYPPLLLGKDFSPVVFYVVKGKTNPDNAQYTLSGCLS